MPQQRFHRVCILCDTKVKKLAQHLRRQHDVPKEQAIEMSKANKEYLDKQNIPELSKSGRKRWVCGFSRCGKIVVNRTHHLEYKHHLQKGSDIFSEELSKFRQHLPGKKIESSDSESLPDIETALMSEGEIEQEQEPNPITEETDITEDGTDYAVPPTPPGGSTGHWQCMLDTLKDFEKDLTSIQGGMKPAHVARQHCKQVQKFWEFIGHKTTAVFKVDNLNLWVESLLQEFKPGTIKSYLCSISTFLKFAFAKNLLMERVQTLTECTNFIQNSMRFLAKRQAQRQVEVDEQATEELLDPEARSYILNGKYLDKVKEQFKMDRHSYYNAYRDALMLYITVSNGTRVSALMNMTIPQIHKAASSIVDQTEYFTISVLKHKTSASRGAAKISLPKKEYKYLRTLAEHVARCYPGDERLFRNQLGAPFASQSQINYRIQQAWKMSGAYSKFGRLNSRINRQTMTCQGRERDPTKAKEIADQLKHRVTTADKFYHVYSSAGASAKTVHWLNETATRDRNNKSNSDDNTSDDDDQFFMEHDIPCLPENISSQEIRAAIVEVLRGRGIEEMIEEAAAWKYKIRKFTVDTCYLSIHRALRKKLEKSNINIDEEILGLLSIDSLNSDMQLKTTFLSVFAVEVARHYGCSDDVNATPFKRTVAPTPPPPRPSRKGKGIGKKTSGNIPDTPRLRAKIAPEVVNRIKEVYADIIQKARSGEEPVLFKNIRERIHLFPDFTSQQIRDKIKNILKYEK